VLAIPPHPQSLENHPPPPCRGCVLFSSVLFCSVLFVGIRLGLGLGFSPPAGGCLAGRPLFFRSHARRPLLPRSAIGLPGCCRAVSRENSSPGRRGVARPRGLRHPTTRGDKDGALRPSSAGRFVASDSRPRHGSRGCGRRSPNRRSRRSRATRWYIRPCCRQPYFAARMNTTSA